LSKKVDDQTEMIKDQTEMIKDQTIRINKLIGTSEDIKSDLDLLVNITTETIERDEMSQMTTCVASKDRINVPTNKCNIESNAIIRNNEPDAKFKYKSIRGVYSYVKLTIGKHTGTKFTRLGKDNKEPWLISVVGNPNEFNYTFIKAYADVPNARHLFRASRELIFETSGVNFNFNNSEPELIQHIQDIFDNRLVVPLLPVHKSEAVRKSSTRVREAKSKTKTAR
jgi:hypothetical protein